MGNVYAIDHLDVSNYSLICRYETIKEASKALGVCPATITNAIKRYGGYIQSKDVRVRFSTVQRKPRRVHQLEYQTGEIIETYDSILDAAYDNDVLLESIKQAINLRGGYMGYKKLRFRYEE